MMSVWKRTGLGAAVIAMTAGLTLHVVPAQAAAPVPRADIGGFASSATASPLRIEIFEEALPIPVDPGDPQLEFDLAYTTVIADSGPSSSARASVLWPGSALGDGLETMLEQFGLPGDLFPDGYPAQVNAAYNGETDQEIDEPVPGMVQRVTASGTRTVAQAGHTSAGEVAEGDPEGTTAKNPLEALMSGDLGAFGSFLFGNTKKRGDADNPVSSNPLGMFSALVAIDGMSSAASTDYNDTSVTATATSRTSEIRLLGGLITFHGINVVTKVVSTPEGTKPARSVEFGGMSILGQKVAFGPDGFEAGGNKIAIPGLPKDAGKAMEKLGFSIELPEPVLVQDGPSASLDVDAMRIIIDLEPLLGKLPKLPWAKLMELLPMPEDAPDMLKMLTSMLPSLLEATPKIVMRVGTASVSASTVAPWEGDGFDDFGGEETAGGIADDGGLDIGGDDGGLDIGGDDADLGDLDDGGFDDSGLGDLGDADLEDAAALLDTSGPMDGGMTPTNLVATTRGLPALGSIPTLLVLLGLLVAAGVGRYMALAGRSLFGVGAACTHGLKTGVPDLRKV